MHKVYNTSEKAYLQGLFHAVFQLTADICVLANNESDSDAKIYFCKPCNVII